jgi:hypothetical protein
MRSCRSRGPYQRFRRALAIGRLPLVLAAAAELPRLDVADALETDRRGAE